MLSGAADFLAREKAFGERAVVVAAGGSHGK